ncbi:MAG: hypothetical protein E7091_07630 [Bacteroidales bacterium]|nr:hypothetical protein [Bacteroidales bacterium]
MNKKSLLYVAATLMLFGCEDYNELNFDGYKDLSVPTDVKSINYTLKKADYADLFKLAANKDVATSTIKQNEDGSLDSTMYDAFEANKSNNYFTDLVPAELYLPAFLADKWSTATDGSSAIITVNELAEVPELHQQIAQAYSYELSEYDYEMVWEDGEGHEFFCPSRQASKYMNRILKDNFDDAEVGEVVLVNYEYAENDPTTGNEEVEVKYDAISDILENGEGEYTVKGQVVGTYARGYLISDGSDYILYYVGSNDAASIGDFITVTGTVTKYAGLFQFDGTKFPSTMNVISKGNKLNRPTPRALNNTEIEKLFNNPTVEYVSYTGTLTISGNYYNVNFEGVDTIIGSISYPVEGLVDASLDGQKVTVTGYFIGVSSGKYFNTMATSVTAADAAATAPRRAAAVANTTSVLALYQWDGTSWKAIDADVIQPAEYEAMGMKGSISDPATYIPMYLEKNYPYAVNKQETTLVYYNKSNKLVVENYIYNGSEWTNTALEEGVYNFNLIDGQWVYKTFKCVPVSEVTESGIYVMVADIKVNEETGVTEGRLFSPLGENKNYGYMPYASVTINEEGIIEACDAAENAFLTVTAVEDGFTMQDSYGRYIYMKGDYNSFNIGTEMVQPGSSWLFNVNEDGTYSVTNTMNDKVIMYDTGYTSYGCYPAKTDARLYVNIFKMTTEE